MNIDKLKQKVYPGAEDGSEFAFVKGDVVHLIQAHDMGDAILRAKNLGLANTNEWMLSNDKAVLIPGLWEYEMAVCIKGLNQDQIADLAEQLREAA